MNDQTKPIPAATPAAAPLPPPSATGNFAPPPAAAPAPGVGTPDAKAQAELQKRLAEKMHGPQGHIATEAERAHAASTSTLLTTDAHVGKRTGEPHKDQAQEDLKVGAATRTIDETRKVETVEISTGTPPNEGTATDTAVLGREGQSLARGAAAPPTHDATAVAAAVAEKTGVGIGENKPPVEGAQPSKAAADPAHAGEADAESKGKPTEPAKPAEPAK